MESTPEEGTKKTSTSDKMVLPVDNVAKQTTRASKLKDTPIVGNITSHIGSGEHAKDSFIWVTITWSFIIGSSITGLIMVRSWFDVSTAYTTIESIKSIWTVFIPLITLALGYAFGKGK